jgi:hypothetical protein
VTFRRRLHESKTLMPIAAASLIAGIMWPYLFHPATQLGKNLSLAFRGMLLGFSIAVNLGAVWMKRHQSRCDGEDATGQ